MGLEQYWMYVIYESANIKSTVMKSEVQSLSFMEKKRTVIILEKDAYEI